MKPVESQESFWERLGQPKYVAAPMVGQSELPFRILVRRYGVQLAYTPMLHSRMFAEDKKYRSAQFSSCSVDRPLIAQFCGSEPTHLVKSATLVAEHVDAVDVNFGCPQAIAKRGQYGAYLLNQPDLIEHIIQVMVQSLPIPITCKLRKVSSEDLQKTVNLACRLEAAGCSAICLHGRTLEEKGQFTKKADWSAIQAVKRALRIPVIANGGIASLDEANQCLLETGAEAVMSAEALLENPALFNETQPVSRDQIVQEYFDLVDQYPVPVSSVKAHLFRFLFTQLHQHTDLRTALAQAKSLQALRDVYITLKNRPDVNFLNNPLFWYYRHRCSEIPTPHTSSCDLVFHE